jgi:hypothetical protein
MYEKAGIENLGRHRNTHSSPGIFHLCRGFGTGLTFPNLIPGANVSFVGRWLEGPAEDAPTNPHQFAASLSSVV